MVMTESIWHRYRQTKDVTLRDALVVEHLPLVKYLAGRLAAGLPAHVEASDLESYGLFGLFDAVDRFEEARGVKFETYASTRIRGAMLDGLRRQDPAPPVWRERAKKLEQAYAAQEATLGRAATDQEIADHLGLSLAELRKWEQETAALIVLPLGEIRRESSEGESTLAGLEAVASPSGETPEEQAMAAERRRILAAAIEALPERERLVIALYYYEEIAAKEVAEILGVTASRVSQLHSKALLRLRAALAAHSQVAFS